MASVWGELKRRNVVRVAAAYALVSWLILQLADVLMPLLTLPDWVGRFVFLLLVIGFLLAVVLSWAYELTPEGVRLEKEVDRSQSITPSTGRKLDFIIIGVLVVALVFFAVDKFVWTEAIEPVVTANDSQHTIAVLPLVNLSSDPEQEYFSDGLAEELLNLLTRIPELRVTSRSSAFSYKGKDFRIADVGRELNVGHVLEGSVRRSGDTIRITVQLIDVKTDTHIWSDTWDRSFDDVFVIQDEIAQAVVDALRIRLLGDTPRVAETSPEAYSLYLQGQYLFAQRNIASHHQSVELFKQALDIDREYVAAWLGLAAAYDQSFPIGIRSREESIALVLDAVNEVLRLDANNGRAHSLLGRIAMDSDIETATRKMQQALALAPNDSVVIGYARSLAVRIGEFDEAIRLGEKHTLLDPVFPGAWYSLGGAYFVAGRLDDAERAYRRAIELNPERIGSHARLGAVILLSGNHDAALASMNREVSTGRRIAGRALVFQAMGDQERASVELETLIELGYQWTYEIAQNYALRGELDEAFVWLDRAFERRDSALVYAAGDPFLDNLRDDPRFENVLEQLGVKSP